MNLVDGKIAMVESAGGNDMLDSLTFGVVLAILVAWVFAWGLIAAVVATSKQQDPIGGLVQGLTLGPVGVLFVALSTTASSTRGKHSKSSGDSQGVVGSERVERKRDLYS